MNAAKSKAAFTSGVFRQPVLISSTLIKDIPIPSTSRLPELDLLRGLAIVLVLGRHMLWVPDVGGGWSGTVFRAWRHFGWIGVDLFFVLSGFLVGGLLIREQKFFGAIHPWRFLVRRGIRIYPPFYVFLLASLCLSRAVGLRFQNWPAGLWSEFFFFQNYVPGLWPQTWSLALEEHFYLLLVCLLVWMSTRNSHLENRFNGFPKLVFVVNSAILLGRLWATYGTQAPWSVLTFQTQWRLDSLLFGVLLAYGLIHYPIRMSRLRKTLRPWRLPGFLILIFPSMMLNLNEDRYVWTLGSTALYLGIAWILLEAILTDTASKSQIARALAVLSLIGRHSYSIYLWHFTIYYIGYAYIHHKLGWKIPLGLDCLGFVFGAIICGMIMSHLIEQPMLRCRDRYFPARARIEQNKRAIL